MNLQKRIVCIIVGLFLAYGIDVYGQYVQLKALIVEGSQLQETVDLKQKIKTTRTMQVQGSPFLSNTIELLKQLNEKSMSASVVLRSLKALPEKQRDGYQELPFQLTVEGGYSALIQFLKDIVRLQYVLTLDEITITPLVMEVSLRAYQVKTFSENYSDRLLNQDPDSTSSRDPFLKPVTRGVSSLAEVPLEMLRFSGVLWEREKPRALVEDREGRLYVLAVGEVIGVDKAVVIEITKEAVLIRKGEGNILLSLSK